MLGRDIICPYILKSILLNIHIFQFSDKGSTKDCMAVITVSCISSLKLDSVAIGELSKTLSLAFSIISLNISLTDGFLIGVDEEKAVV